VEALGLKPRLILGSPENLKITYPADLVLAAAILAAQGREGTTR
jgi:2-C-methyl-D-erythritol 4-phosphate cytidylyltransferase